MHPTTQKLLSMPTVEWDAAIMRVGTLDRVIVTRDLEELIERAARLHGYIEARGTEDDAKAHAAGVRQSTKFATKVRNALGFGPTREAITQF